MIKFFISLAIVICASLFFYNLGFSNASIFNEEPVIQTCVETPQEKEGTYYGYYDNFSEDIVIKTKDLDVYQTFYVMMHEGFHKYYDEKYEIDLVDTDPKNEELAEQVLDDFHCYYDGNEAELVGYFHEICNMGYMYE